jgi:hypothetical protein
MPVDPMRHAKGTTRALKLAAGENRLLKLSLPSGARAVKLFPFPKSLRVSNERGRHPAFSAIGWPENWLFGIPGPDRASRYSTLDRASYPQAGR